MTGSSILHLVTALGATLGLLLVAVQILKRLQGGAFAGGSSKGTPLRVLKRVPVGPKQGIALLQVGDRVLVVSIADAGARLLTELDGESAREALDSGSAGPAAARGGSRPASTPKPKRAAFLRLGGFAACFAVLCALTAQADAQGTPADAQGTPDPLARVTNAAAASARDSLVRIQALAPKPAPPAHAGANAPQIASVMPPIAPKVDIRFGEGENALHLNGSVGLVIFLGVLTLLPALFLLMTSFTRILIVLQFLRPAIGLQTSPPGPLLAALALLMTGVVMGPVIEKANQTALQPYFQGRITQAQAYKIAVEPFREFMLANTREKDIAVFADLSGASDASSAEEIPTVTLVSSFVTSELRTAFQMGFVIFLPFIVVDVIVASVLMSLGMFMLPPMMVSLPFKLLLFVLADGWTLVVSNLITSFR